MISEIAFKCHGPCDARPCAEISSQLSIYKKVDRVVCLRIRTIERMKFSFLVHILMVIMLAFVPVRCNEEVDSQENINNSSFLVKKGCRRGYYRDDMDKSCKKFKIGVSWLRIREWFFWKRHDVLPYQVWIMFLKPIFFVCFRMMVLKNFRGRSTKFCNFYLSH